MLTDNLNSIEKDSLLTTLGNIIRSIKNLETQLVLNKKQISAQPSWVAPTFTNSWVNFGGAYEVAGYGLDQRNFVILKGVVKTGTVGTPIFTLPAGFRPAARRIFSVVSSNGAEIVSRLDIEADGDVILVAGGNVFATLDGVSFYAEA